MIRDRRHLQFPDVLHVQVVHCCAVRDGQNLALNLISEHQVGEVLRIHRFSVCPDEHGSLTKANLQARRDDGNIANWGFSCKDQITRLRNFPLRPCPICIFGHSVHAVKNQRAFPDVGRSDGRIARFLRGRSLVFTVHDQFAQFK